MPERIRITLLDHAHPPHFVYGYPVPSMLWFRHGPAGKWSLARMSPAERRMYAALESALGPEAYQRVEAACMQRNKERFERPGSREYTAFQLQRDADVQLPLDLHGLHDTLNREEAEDFYANQGDDSYESDYELTYGLPQPPTEHVGVDWALTMVAMHELFPHVIADGDSDIVLPLPAAGDLASALLAVEQWMGLCAALLGMAIELPPSRLHLCKDRSAPALFF